VIKHFLSYLDSPCPFHNLIRLQQFKTKYLSHNFDLKKFHPKSFRKLQSVLRKEKKIENLNLLKLT
jgi:hypothetical protein